MVNWGRAFRGAAGVLGFAIVWWIIGVLIIGAGVYVLGWGFSLSFPAVSSLTRMFLGAVLIFLGCIVGILGTLAALLKILPEIVAEEVRKV